MNRFNMIKSEILDEIDKKQNDAYMHWLDFRKKYNKKGLLIEESYEELKKLEHPHFTREELCALIALLKTEEDYKFSKDITARPTGFEGAVCYYKTINNTWITYKATERGKAIYIREFDNVYDLCIEILDRSYYLLPYVNNCLRRDRMIECFNNHLKEDISEEEINDYIKWRNRHDCFKKWIYEKEPKLVKKM